MHVAQCQSTGRRLEISIKPTVLSPQWVTAIYLPSWLAATILGSGPVSITLTMVSALVSTTEMALGSCAFKS